MNAYSTTNKRANHIMLFSVILIQETKENFADCVLLLLLTLDLQDHLEFQANPESQVMSSLCWPKHPSNHITMPLHLPKTP